MSSNLVIVAIPEEGDRVWKISSEKIPHLTILHLGDSEQVSNLQSIVQFVEHAVSTSLKRFYLPVDHRGELGEAKADVLFFKKNRYDVKAVRDFRSLLLKDSNIKSAYDATSQFELPAHVGAPGQAWIPHLTLGYPETPAKPIPDDHMSTIYDVSFNKLAVWVGDYEGPEFLLKDYWDDIDEMGIPMDVAMSDIQHHGTKGMKWGVRKQELAGGGHIRVSNRTGQATISNSSVALYVAGAGVGAFLSPRFRREWNAANVHNNQLRVDKKNAKKDKKWEKQIYTVPSAVKVHNEMANHFNSRIEAINKKPEYGKLDLNNNPDSPLAKKYLKEANDLTMEGNRLAVQKVHGKSPSGKKEARLSDDGERIQVVDVEKKVEHAVDENYTISFTLRWDEETGKILEMNTAEEGSSAEHTIDLGAEFLEHYGVKGMRWGVQRDDISRAAESSSSKLGAAVREADRFTRDVEFEANTRDRIDPHTRVQEASKAKQDVEEKGYANFRKQDLPVIKKKPDYVKASKLRNRLLHPRDPATKAYRKEVKEAYIKRLEEAANSMANASGTRQYTIREEGGALPGSKYSWEVSTREVKHAAIEEHKFTVDVILDEDGFVTELKKSGDTLAQSMDFGSVLINDLLTNAEAIEHYGVKGMRWGVRRGAPLAVAPTAASHVPRGTKRKTKIKTEGGENHPASEDAIKVAKAKAKLQKSGTAALSNKELQDLQTRMNLERNVTQLMPPGSLAAKGRKFVKGLTGANKDANEFGRGALNTRNILREARG